MPRRLLCVLLVSLFVRFGFAEERQSGLGSRQQKPGTPATSVHGGTHATYPPGQALSVLGSEEKQEKRALLQTTDDANRSREYVCSLSSSQTANYLDSGTRTWLIDSAALDEIGNNLQSVVNCTEEGDTILFDVARIIRPSSRVTIKWSLVLSSYTDKVGVVDGVFVKTDRKTVFACPRENEGIFLVSGAENVLFANLEFRECSVRSVSLNGAIIEVEGCPTRVTMSDFLLHHVTFTRNRLLGATCLRFNEHFCSRTRWVDVSFIDNSCAGVCASVLPASSVFRDVHLEENEHVTNSNAVRSLLSASTGSSITAIRLTATRNKEVILQATNADLALTGSVFVRNSGDISTAIDGFSACIHLINSSAVIDRSTFAENQGESGSVIFGEHSSVKISNSTFTSNRANRGGVLCIKKGSDASLINCSFSSNEASDRGAVLFSSDSIIRSMHSNFTDNSANVTGGCFHLESSSELNMRETSAMRNTARYGGFAVFVGNSSGRVEDSVFSGNKAVQSGGSYYTDESKLTVGRCQFAQGSATWGGFFYSTQASALSVTYSRFNRSVSRQGGSLYAKGVSHIDLHSVAIESNAASDCGGGICLREGSVANITDSNIRLNDAGNNGGAIYADASQVFLHNTRLMNNSAASGGGVRVMNGTEYEASNCMIMGNAANFGGGVVMQDGSTANLIECVFLDNKATTSGGHLYSGRSRFSCADCHFERGHSQFGGFVFSAESTIHFERSSFMNASASVGGCFRTIEGTSLSVENGSLTACEAERSGGGVSSTNSTLEIRNSELSGNDSGRNGGAINADTDASMRLVNTSLLRNRAESGGAVLIRTNVTGEIVTCEFRQNDADKSGGHLFLEESNITISRSQFHSGTARTGGALHATADALVYISNSVFSRCRAESKGGCLFLDDKSVVQLHNSNLKACVTRKSGGALYAEDSAVVIMNNLRFRANRAERFGGAILAFEANLFATALVLHNNHAGENGGAAYFEDSDLVSIRNSGFRKNWAQLGGAMILLRARNATLENTTFIENSARVRGCAIYVRESELRFRDGHMSGNHGGTGGGFYSNNATLAISNSDFGNGSVTDSGGFILAEDGGSVTLEGVSMTGGQAEDGGAVALRGSALVAHRFRVFGCSAEEGGAVFANQSSTFLCADCIFEGNSANSKGGAMSFVSDQAQLLALQFDRVVFKRNSAENGGGLHLITLEENTDCAKPAAQCTFVVLTHTKFTENNASHAGGAVLASDPSVLRIDCSTRMRDYSWLVFYSKSQFETFNSLKTLDDLCSSWNGNEAGVYGRVLGSYARQVTKIILNEKKNETATVTGNRYTIRGHSSGTPLPSITLHATDAFGQGPAKGMHNSEIIADMRSPDNLFSGSVRVSVDNHSSSFTGIVDFQSPGKYRVRIDFSEEALPSFHIMVIVRECKVGEILTANGLFCQPCNGATYSVMPDTEAGCLPCPFEGNCTTNVIQPNRGHWHHNPCSDRIQRCLTARTCDFSERKEKLTDMTEDLESCEFDEDFLSAYSKAQCAEGYRGPLCGSCDQSYGRTQLFACRKCFINFANVALVVLSILMLMGLSTFTIRSNLTSTVKALRDTAVEHQALFVGPSSTCRVAVNERTVEMASTANVTSETRTTSTQNTPNSQQSDDQSDLLKWKAAELFKITINNLQVTAVAISINVDWQQSLIGLFETAEFLSGVTSEATNRSVDCLVSDDSSIPRSVISTVIDVLVPLVVIVLFILIWVMFSFKQTESKIVYMSKKALLSALAVFYIAYISITKTLINILPCIEVHEPVEIGTERTTEYWAVDTSLKCYEDSHAVLAGLIGWPFLFVFTLGFPIAVASVIVTQVQEDFKEGWIYQTAGFLYRSYQPRFVFWESIVLLRKAVLAVVVVFAYPLGGNLQAVLGVLVLTLALYFHTLFRPYRTEFDILNEVESASLLVSLLTFVSSFIFDDDRVSDWVRSLVTTIIFLGNLGLLFSLVWVFTVTASSYLKNTLERLTGDYNLEGGTLHVLKVYLQHCAFAVAAKWVHHILPRKGSHSSNSNVAS